MNSTFSFEKCIADTAEFFAKFGGANPLEDAAQADLRIKRLDEEFDELAAAIDSGYGTMRDAADAVIDIIYIAAGTTHLLGDKDGGLTDHINLSKDVLKGYFAILVRNYHMFPFQALWDEVHSANMRKERGSESTSKYGNKYDIVKPAGWIPPFLDNALRAAKINPSQSANEWHVANGL